MGGPRVHAGKQAQDAEDRPARCCAQDRLDAGSCRDPQRPRHLAAEAAAGDQCQSLDALGELVEELHRHAAAERVADDRRAVDAQPGEQVADAGGVGAEGVVALGPAEPPCPMRSGAMTVCVSARRSATPRQCRDVLSIPWIEPPRARSRRCGSRPPGHAAPSPRSANSISLSSHRSTSCRAIAIRGGSNSHSFVLGPAASVHLLAREPARFLELVVVRVRLAGRVVGLEADHQLRRGTATAGTLGSGRRRRATPRLLRHLARDRRLQRLAGLDEPGQRRVAAGRPVGLATHQRTVPVDDEHDHDRIRPRVGDVIRSRSAREAGLARLRAPAPQTPQNAVRRGASAAATARRRAGRRRRSTARRRAIRRSRQLLVLARPRPPTSAPLGAHAEQQTRAAVERDVGRRRPVEQHAAAADTTRAPAGLSAPPPATPHRCGVRQSGRASRRRRSSVRPWRASLRAGHPHH